MGKHAGNQPVHRITIRFDPASVEARYDEENQRLTLRDTEGRYWTIYTPPSSNLDLFRQRDAATMTPLLAALRTIVPRVELGSIQDLPTLLRWAVGILITCGILLVLLIGLVIYAKATAPPHDPPRPNPGFQSVHELAPEVWPQGEVEP